MSTDQKTGNENTAGDKEPSPRSDSNLPKDRFTDKRGITWKEDAGHGGGYSPRVPDGYDDAHGGDEEG